MATVLMVRIFKVAFISWLVLTLALLVAALLSGKPKQPTSVVIHFPDRAHRKQRLVANKRNEDVLSSAEKIEQLGVCDNAELLTKLSAKGLPLRIQYQETCEQLERDKNEFFKLLPVRVNTFRPDMLVTASDTCDSDTDVIILVHSLHDYVTKRAAIRATWGHAVRNNNWLGAKLPLNVRMVFVHGVHRQDAMERKLRKEIVDYGDIIQGNFYEDYKNMTLKSLFGLKWKMTFCPQARFLIKADDDIFLNLPVLLDVITDSDMSRSIMGPLNVGSKAVRSGKWALTRKEYPFYFLPMYESGSTYVISNDVIPELFNASEFCPHQLHIDDVYVTGILGKIVNVTHKRQGGFAYATTRKPTPCGVLDNATISGIFSKPSQHVALWEAVTRGDRSGCEQI